MKGKWLKLAVVAMALLGVVAATGCYGIDVDIDPDSLNLMEKTNGKAVITAYVTADIIFDLDDVETVEVACPMGSTAVDANWVKIAWLPLDPGDPYSPLIKTLVVKFDRKAVVEMVKAECDVDQTFDQWVRLVVTVNDDESDNYWLRVLMPELAPEE